MGLNDSMALKNVGLSLSQKLGVPRSIYRCSYLTIVIFHGGGWEIPRRESSTMVADFPLDGMDYFLYLICWGQILHLLGRYLIPYFFQYFASWENFTNVKVS